MVFTKKEATLKNGMALTLREAVSGDAEQIIRYFDSVGKESENLMIDENGLGLTVEEETQFLTGISGNPNHLMIAGLVCGELASLSTLERLTARRRGCHNAVISLSVKKKFWHIGIGQENMKALFTSAKQAGIENLHLDVRAENRNAIALYEQFGFQKCGTYKNRMKFNGRYADCHIMQAYVI